jgi:predicted nucleic acid-binding protein
MPGCIFDTSCLINACAAAPLETWLPRLGVGFLVPVAVQRELLYLRGEDAQGKPKREPIELQRYVDLGILGVAEPSSAKEFEFYVGYARELDDGEAMALALARSRALRLSSDDRKAIRLAREAGVAVYDTPDILKSWWDKGAATPEDLSRALENIRRHALYMPPKDHPLRNWWIEHSVGGA